MRFFSKALLVPLGLAGIASALPAPPEESTAPIVKSGYLPPPPGLDVSKHQKPPKGFKIPDYFVNSVSISPASLEKRDEPWKVHVVLCDNWYFGGQCIDAIVDPSGWNWPVGWLPYSGGAASLENRVSSVKVYNTGDGTKQCRFFLGYYYQGADVYCYGDYFDFQVGPYRTASMPKIDSPYNDKIVCGACWYV